MLIIDSFVPMEYQELIGKAVPLGSVWFGLAD